MTVALLAWPGGISPAGVLAVIMEGDVDVPSGVEFGA
jgi:hypothetical protein